MGTWASANNANNANIVDAHVHEPAGYDERFDRLSPAQRAPVSCELLLAGMDAIGVERAVLVSANAALSRYIARRPVERLGFIADSPEPGADPCRALLAARRAGALGVRLLFSMPYPRSLQSTAPPANVIELRRGGFDPVIEAARKAGLPLLVFAPDYLADVGTMAARFPDVRWVLDHIGLRQPLGLTRPVSEVDRPPFRRLPELLALAKHGNVLVKLSGVPTLSADGYPFADVMPVVQLILEAFGADRVMWGSDIQRCRARCYLGSGPLINHPDTPGRHTYGQALDYIRASDALSSEVKHQILSATALSTFCWN